MADSGSEDGAAIPDADAATDTEIQDVVAETQPLDDPCPTAALYLNCSSDCGGPDAACFDPSKRVMCSPSPSKVSETNHKAFPLVIRTPSHPGSDPNCAGVCSKAAPVFAIGVTVSVPFDYVYALRVKVSPPWRIWFMEQPNDVVCWEGAQENCAVRDPGTFVTVYLVTDDPNAPARNATLERLIKPVSCQ